MNTNPNGNKNKILVVGDWGVAENWLTDIHRTLKGSLTGRAHCRVIPPEKRSVWSLCGAGLTARHIYNAKKCLGATKGCNESSSISFNDVIGMGTWHSQDEGIIKSLMKPWKPGGPGTPYRLMPISNNDASKVSPPDKSGTGDGNGTNAIKLINLADLLAKLIDNRTRDLFFDAIALPLSEIKSEELDRMLKGIIGAMEMIENGSFKPDIELNTKEFEKIKEIKKQAGDKYKQRKNKIAGKLEIEEIIDTIIRPMDSIITQTDKIRNVFDTHSADTSAFSKDTLGKIKKEISETWENQMIERILKGNDDILKKLKNIFKKDDVIDTIATKICRLIHSK